MRNLLLLSLLGCASLRGAPVPEVPATVPPYDVVLYTAHPDDESMYAGGTLDRLRRAGRKVAVVVMSHGEGGRLLEKSRDGSLVERRDYSMEHVARVRDREMGAAARIGGFELSYLYPASARSDFAFTTSSEDTLAHWEKNLPGGTAELARRIAADIRVRRPRVILTLDPRDDPTGSRHGHHSALGELVLRAAQSDGDTEVLTFAPQAEMGDVTIDVEPSARLSLLRAHASQFPPEALSGPGARPTEQFVVKRGDGRRLLGMLAPHVEGGTLLEIFPLYVEADAAYALLKKDATWQVGFVPSVHPHETVRRSLANAGHQVLLLHSTSWRHETGKLILTYVAVLPAKPKSSDLRSVVIEGAELARGGATTPPQEIATQAVLTHAMQHLSWLMRTDPEVGKALCAKWAQILSRFAPKPFLAID